MAALPPASAVKTAFPRLHLIAATLLLSATVLIAWLLPSEEAAAIKSVVPLTLPAPTTPQSTEQPAVAVTTALVEPELWDEYVVQTGDTLGTLFKRAGIAPNELAMLLDSGKETKRLHQIHPGHKLALQVGTEGQLERFKFSPNALESVQWQRTNDSFDVTVEKREPELQLRRHSGVIDQSLFLSCQKAGLSQAVASQLADLFGWDIDYTEDLRQGDRFSVIYQERFIDGKKIDDGPILAAEFINQGRRYQTVRHVDAQGNEGYYTPDGRGMRKAFIRNPLDVVRITSLFSLSRFHPILHTMRAHKGIDYSASAGTPVKSVGDGRVTFAGRKGGYGNTITIQHGDRYTTLYAHLQGFAPSIRNGQKVRQGEVIGYVGASGLATGNHLHYEFQVDGVHRNPLTVPLPQAPAVAGRELDRFKSQTGPLVAMLKQGESTPAAVARAGLND